MSGWILITLTLLVLVGCLVLGIVWARDLYLEEKYWKEKQRLTAKNFRTQMTSEFGRLGEEE